MFRNKKRNEENQKRKSDVILEPLILQNSRLKFSQEQLQNLNFMFHKKLQYQQDYSDKSIKQAKSVAERLLQRLLCSVGSIDSRFSSKFLIENDLNNKSSGNLSFILRLDDISSPSINHFDLPPKIEIIENDPDCPPSYCRIRLPMSKMKLWGEFLNPQGFLRRDKVQTRLVKLLAEAANSDFPNSPLSVDESILNGIPGKIVNAYHLHYLLQIPSNEHIFYGPGGSIPRFPDPRDFRIAIIDEPDGVRLRIEFLSPNFQNTCINITILLAVTSDAWTKTSSFPQRIPLTHSDCLLYYKSASCGIFLVGFGVQSSAWQIRAPAAEITIMEHYSENSVVETVLDILYDSIDEIEISRNLKKHQQMSYSYKILNKYIVRTALLEELEKSSKPLNDLVDWSPMYLSSIVLRILDQLMSSLIQQMMPNYFFKSANLMVNPGHLSEDDYIIEANNVKFYILRLFDESIKSLSDVAEFSKMIKAQDTETKLLSKWRELINGMLPKLRLNNSRGFCFIRSQNRYDFIYSHYTQSQLEYISILLNYILKSRQNSLESQEESSPLGDSLDSNESETQQLLEDVIYLIILLMDQAKDIQFSDNLHNSKKSKLKNQFNQYTSRFVELIRKEEINNIKSSNLEDDLILVKTILKWLYKAVDFNKKYLEPILFPYLNNMFETSFTISWHLDSIKERMNTDELDTLKLFCKLVNSNEITPAQGLMDAYQKNWIWAKNMMEMIEKHTLRIVFIPDKMKINRHILSLPSYKRKELESSGLRRRESTLLERSYFNTIIGKACSRQNSDSSQYEVLKINSPFTRILDKMHRKGEHRGCGDIFKSLLSMQKIGIFHDIISSLPDEDKLMISETIHQLQLAKSRKVQRKKWSNTLPNIRRNATFSTKNVTQKYTRRDEGDEEARINPNKAAPIECSSTLISSCRALRLKEDDRIMPFQSNSRIRTLLRKSESFKY